MKYRRGTVAVRWVMICAAVLALAAGAGAVVHYSQPLVTITEVVEGPVVESFYATGTVSPVTEYPIRNSTAGLLIDLKVDKGDRVTKGQVLAIVSDPQLQLALDKAKADLEEKQKRADAKTSPVLAEFDSKMQASQSMLENAQRDEQRLTDVVNRGAASFTDRDRATDRVKEHWSELESLKAQKAAMQLRLDTELKTAQAALAAAQMDFDRQTLVSPIDGVVLDRPTPRNSRLAINDHVMQVADVRPENLVMRAAVDEENVAEVNVGQKVVMTLYAFPGRTFIGSVRKIYDKAEPDRRTFEMDVTLEPADPKLAAGMTGELAFVVAEKDRSLVAPSQALQSDTVFTIRDGKLAKADAKIGLKSVERIELLSGLTAGDKIVISPTAGLAEGQRVRTTWMDPIVAAHLNKPKEVQVFRGFN
ncbi:MAG TPA: efflux RND transporter periplasmic adaptor subunit [Humisphaera sp.]|jgi:multidrug efflux pump subunit AcrA (membrane-fusion protein)|nr:efflux RND transporter periplasmic adaptor subunit [Humisphaera sp.]